jgi:hypothetical protein
VTRADDVVVAQQVAASLVDVGRAVDAVSQLAAARDVLYPLAELLSVERVPQAAQLLQLLPLHRWQVVDDSQVAGLVHLV